MAAPSYAALYDFETLMEDGIAAALAAIFTANTLTVQVNTTRDTDTEQTPRVDVEFAPGVALAHMTTIGQPNPKQVPDMFDGICTLRISTSRPTSANNAAIHGMIRGWVRYTMSAGARGLSESILPYLQITDMLPAGSASQIYDEKSQDITELTYKVTFAIRQTAWPLN